MTRGEIYFIKNNKQEGGNKPCPDRPAVIVSNDMLNATSSVVEVVYMTTQPWNDMPTHVITRGMGSPSTITCEQIYSVNKFRLGQYAGTLSDDELKAVDAALAISLGIDFDAPEQAQRETVKTVEVEKVVEKGGMREPTEEELDKLLDARANKRFEEAMEEARRTPVQLLPVPADPAVVKAETERDIYHKLYEDMLNTLMVIAKGAKA